MGLAKNNSGAADFRPASGLVARGASGSVVLPSGIQDGEGVAYSAGSGALARATFATQAALDGINSRVTALEDGSGGVQAPPFVVTLLPKKTPPADPTVADVVTNYFHTIRIMNGTSQKINGSNFTNAAYRAAFDVSNVSKAALAIARLRVNTLTNASMQLRWYNETTAQAENLGPSVSLVAASETTPPIVYVDLPAAAIAQGDCEFFLATTSTDSTRNIEMSGVDALFLP